MNDQPTLEASDEGLEITRVFDAPRDAVWREWTEPEAFADWYGGAAAEVPVDTVEMDVRDGGEWKATMNVSSGTVIYWRGTYREVREPERLAFTVTDEPEGTEFDLVEVELIDLGDNRTEMRMKQTGGHMDEAGYRRAGQGWGGFFDRMDERLSA